MGKNMTMQELKTREMSVFSTIPGMNELLRSSSRDRAKAESKYPDAVFAMEIASSLFNHDRELSLINQRAYFSILNGENIGSVRRRYNRETNKYWEDHMWDE